MEINPRYVRQEDPSLRASWFRDTRSGGGGELMLWVDMGGQLRAFQLSCENSTSNREYLAHWKSGQRIKLGTVDSGEADPGTFKMSPTISFKREPFPEELGVVLTYFQNNSWVVKEKYRRVILNLLDRS